MFEPLRVHAAEFGPSWPDLADLQRLLDERAPVVRNAGRARAEGRAAGRAGRRAWEESYEARVFLKGELQMREGNWHDLLNVAGVARVSRERRPRSTRGTTRRCGEQLAAGAHEPRSGAGCADAVRRGRGHRGVGRRRR